MTAIEQLASSFKEFNDLFYTDQSNPRNFSRCIKASASIRRKMNDQNELNLALIFPNSQNIINEFLIFEILRAIHCNEIQANYTLDNFSDGEKVSVGKASLIYRGKDNERVILQCSDVNKVSIPIKYAPILQKSKSKQLSSVSLFDKERKRLGSSIGLLSAIASNKTHMNKTIVFINLDSSMIEIVSDLSSISLNGQSIKDLLYITKLVNGKPENVFSSKDSGISPLLCASDFVDLLNSDVHDHIHSIIIKYSQRIENNISFIQSLFELKVPITLIMDSKSYIESSIMSPFKVWIWDKTNIQALSAYGDFRNYKYINNCANQDVKYEIVNDELINDCFISITETFGMMKKNLDSFEGYMFVLDLYQMVLDLVRSPFVKINAVKNSADEIAKLQTIKDAFEDRKNFLDPVCYNNLNSVAQNLATLYSKPEYNLAKGETLRKILKDYYEKQKDVYLIVPDNIDQKMCADYIKSVNGRATVLRASDFLEIDACDSICIVVGWLSRKQMLNLLYSYNTKQIVVLLYSAENHKWKESTNRRWTSILSSSNRLHVDIKNDAVELTSVPNQEENDDLDEEDLFRRTVLLSRHKKYREQNSELEKTITVDASSLEFLGNQFMFVTDKHKMLIVDSSMSKVHSYQIKDVKEGDFLVIRKSSRDIIKEEADRILLNSGYLNARDVSSEWKPILENLFWKSNRKYSSLYDELKAKGCSVTLQTFRMWVNEPEMIMMDSIGDLESILNLSFEKPSHTAREIYECGMLVRSAHLEAGRTLSDKLRFYLMRNKPNDMFNATIDMDIPGIGEISLMKISGISHEKEQVETKYVHRLLS